MDKDKNTGKYANISEIEEIAKGFDANMLLKLHGYRNRPLDFETAYAAGLFALAPYVEEVGRAFANDRAPQQGIGLLCSLHNRALYLDEGSSEQIAGFAAAIFDYDIGTSYNGFIMPDAYEVIDNCGMGGDLHRTPNLSTIAALIASADGALMLKHGSPGNTDSVGSSDFLAHCGVNLFPDKKTVEEAVERFCFGYTDALDVNYKRIHQQTHVYAGLAHMNDIIGPITNPVHPTYMKKRIIGINHLIPPERVAHAYRILNEKGITHVEHGLFVRGFADKKRNGGIDEVSIMPGGTLVAELKDGAVRTYDLFARDFGLEEITAEDLDPGADKAETSRKILSGEIKGAGSESAIANAAIIFYLSDDLELKEGAKKARGLLSSGKPYQILQEYAAFSRGDRR